MPPLEVWERVFVSAKALEDIHTNFMSCIDCHGGVNVDGLDMDAKHAAHEGVVLDPSVDALDACGMCHGDIASRQSDSLHNNLAGYDTVLYPRAPEENHGTIEVGQSYHCDGCHTTCGQCHISRPDSVGGGFVDGHVFKRTPSMNNQCTACHGSRVKNEYTGAHEGFQADVHLRARMVCTTCHTAGELHGTDFDADNMPQHRYDGSQGPSCESCHEEQIGENATNLYHTAHGTDLLSCQACHSVAYMNCYSCHLERTDDEYDLAYFRLEHEELAFYIGRNPLQNEDRPYEYVPVRHVPTWPGLFDYYGEDVLSNFEALPTWTYATPHNIQLRTPQTESCTACHGNDAVFLTADKVEPETLAQNAAVILSGAPPLPGYNPTTETDQDD